MARSTRKISPATRQAIYARDGHRCVYCGATHIEAVLSLDHVVAYARGGRREQPPKSLDGVHRLQPAQGKKITAGLGTRDLR
jgi:5-methylcytosine-specific restriction endonuclease McrA